MCFFHLMSSNVFNIWSAPPCVMQYYWQLGTVGVHGFLLHYSQELFQTSQHFIFILASEFPALSSPICTTKVLYSLTCLDGDNMLMHFVFVFLRIFNANSCNALGLRPLKWCFEVSHVPCFYTICDQCNVVVYTHFTLQYLTPI